MLAQREDRNMAFQRPGRPRQHPPPARHQAHMAQFARIAVGAAQRAAVLDHAQPQPDAEIEIAEGADLPSGAIEPLAHCGGGGVVVDDDMDARRLGEQRHRVHARPAGQGGRAHRAHALHLEGAGHHHAHAQEPRRLGAERGPQARDLRGGLGGHAVGAGLFQRDDGMASDFPGGIDQHGHHAVGGDFHARRQRPVGIDRELDRRLPSSAAQPSLLDEQAFGEQFVHDIGHRLRGQLRPPGDLGAAQMPLHADDFQHHAPVMRPVAFGVGADGHIVGRMAFAAAVHAGKPSLQPYAGLSSRGQTIGGWQ